MTGHGAIVLRQAPGSAGALSHVRSATAIEWDDAWAAAPTATFAQSREWCELWCAQAGRQLRPAPVVVEFADGARALLPFAVATLHRGWVRRRYLAAGGGYGSALDSKALSAPNRQALLHYLLGLGNIEWVASPLDPDALALRARAARIQETHLLPLEAGVEALLRGYSHGHRSSLHKAQRNGVTVAPAVSIVDWRAYFDLYQDSLRRWGDKATSNHGWALFERLARLDSSRCMLWIARHAGEPVAGAVCFYAARHAWYWHGAALERALPMGPATALMHGAIEHAHRSGRLWFDFGFSGGHEGVAAFKRGFGAQAVICPVIERTTTWARAIGSLARLRPHRRREPS